MQETFKKYFTDRELKAFAGGLTLNGTILLPEGTLVVFCLG